jgi:hypothetical protein
MQRWTSLSGTTFIIRLPHDNKALAAEVASA